MSWGRGILCDPCLRSFARVKKNSIITEIKDGCTGADGALTEVHSMLRRIHELTEIQKVIQPLHDAYAQIEKLNERGPVMNKQFPDGVCRSDLREDGLNRKHG